MRVLMLFTGVLLMGCAAEPEGPPLHPTATVAELMATMIDPAADLVWDAVGTVITAEGIDHWEPSTDEEWARVRSGAMTIAESANLLMIGDRARDQDTWMRMAEGMHAAGLQALEAADSMDAEAIFAVGEAVYDSCDSCHNLYWVGDADRGRVRE